MSNSKKAQLALAYKRFQWYVDILGDLVNGLDDLFIEAYDADDVRGCKAALCKMSDALNSLEGNELYRTWRTANDVKWGRQ